MIFAYAEDGMFTVHADEAAARRQWEPIDVENGVVVFYDEDGTWLKPEFTTPNRYRFFGFVLTQGHYVLARSGQVASHVDPIDIALGEAAGVEPNPHFDSVDAIRRHIRRATSS